MSRTKIPAARRRGIALIVTLLAVMLITIFLSEFSFTTGLELRSLQTYTQTFRARSLARSAFKAVQSALLTEELLFMRYYAQLQQVLQFSTVPWENGDLVVLEIEPLDPLFNLNRMRKIVPYTPQDKAYWNLFRNTLADAEIGTEGEEGGFLSNPDDGSMAEIYAAIYDWTDGDDTAYDGASLARGAEEGDYFRAEPEYSVKNAPLDRLSEIRLVRGVFELGLEWSEWSRRFTVYERDDGKNNLYPGLINPNLATREEIEEFLVRRRSDGSSEDVQKALDDYAQNAVAIANALISGEDEFPEHTMATIKKALNGIVASTNHARQVFTPAYQIYRIVLVTEVDDIQTRLEAVVRTNRDLATRIATTIKVLEFHLN